MTKIPRSLEEGLRDGRVIPFVGAGVSMAVERTGGGRIFPSWKRLLLDGAARLEQEGKNARSVRALMEDDPPDYLQAARKLRDKLGALWSTFLKEEIDVFRGDVADGSLALAQAVWRLGSRLVITTNYDQVLRWACPNDWSDDLRIWDVNAPAEQAEFLRRGEVQAPTLWHLHGHIGNTAALILTPDGYPSLHPGAGEMEPRPQTALETLRNLLALRPFLFIGFGLDSEHFGLQWILDTFDGVGGPHYALVHRRDAERLRRSESSVELIAFEDFGAPLLELLGELARHVNPALNLGPVDVYLAEVSDSLRSLRKRVHDDLTREGVSVAWDIPPPFDAEGHRWQVTAVLKRARLSIHLLDGNAGRQVDGRPETTYPQEQVRLARDQAQSQLIWVSRQAEVADPEQQAFLTELRRGDRGTSRYRLVEGMPPSELIQEILARLRPDRPLPLPEEPQATPPPVVIHPKFFISYARKDSEFVLRLVKELRAAGVSLWLDQLDIQGGQRWDEAVQKALESSQGMLAVLSPSAVSSQHFKDEVSFALDEEKQIIPVLYQECSVPFRLRRVQYVDFTGDYFEGLAKLLKTLGGQARS